MQKTGALAKAVVFGIQFGTLVECVRVPYDRTVTELVQVWGRLVAWDVICQSVQVAPHGDAI